MELFDNYSYSLRFRINQNNLSTYRKRWDNVKCICESGINKKVICCSNCGHVQMEYLGNEENTEEIVKQWVSYCKMKTNKSLLYLDEAGGGMYNPARGCRLLFRSTKGDVFIKDNDIVIEIVNHPQNHSKWTYPELDDLRQAFVKMMEQKIRVNTYSCIEMNYASQYTETTNSLFIDDDDDDDDSDLEEYEEFETPVFV